MEKDFDKWNTVKKTLEERTDIFCNKREIWWCSVGANVGAEASGKNELFERPALILKIYNIQSVLVAPLTSKPKSDKYHTRINYENRNGWVVLSHARTISPRRLQRKMCRIGKKQYQKVMNDWFSLLKNESAPVSRSLGARRPDKRSLPKLHYKSRRALGTTKTRR